MSAEASKIEVLGRMLQQAGHAHHQAYIETDGYDPEWPLWYAQHLHADLNQALDAQFTISELVYHLILVTNQHEAADTGRTWAEFSADYFFELVHG